ncbi:MAG: dihydrofolate synthase/folylpolyglutamate synthase [Oceanicoccus sp.]|jgi:dihydrofolate synthase/folylpolyglutamate synthase
MAFKDLQGWLSWLETCHPNEIDLGLGRVSLVAQAMAISLQHCHVVTIAGTNGKGSCVAALNTLLLSAGLRVGSYTSPHFLDYNERIALNGEPVSDAVIIKAFEHIEKARGETSLTYFEFSTLAALDIFQHSELDVVLLEVGLGGRLDAVNIIDADIMVVTSISLDHQDWLGSDLEQIGREKAGIFRAGKLAISAGLTPPSSIKQYAEELGLRLYQAGKDYHFEMATSDWRWQGSNQQGQSLQLDHLPLQGLPYESVAAAIQVLALLPHPTDQVDYSSLANLSLAGRFQQLTLNDRQLILDVAHNPAAAKLLASRLQQTSCSGKTYALMAVMADKDVASILAALDDSFDGWFLPQLKDIPRALDADDLRKLLTAQGVLLKGQSLNVCDSVSQACGELLLLMSANDRLVVFGSFFTVAAVLQIYKSGVNVGDLQ